MLKKIILLLVFLIMANSYYAQHTYVLKDNKQEVFGYAEISGINGRKDYSTDFIQGIILKTKELKVVLQDINLNKIDELLLKFDSPMQDFNFTYNNNSVLISGVSLEKRKCDNCIQYYIYNFKTNKLSNLMSLPDFTADKNFVLQKILPIENTGYVFFGNNLKNLGNYSTYAIENSGKEIYKFDHNNDSNKKKDLFIIEMSQSVGNRLYIIYSDKQISDETRYHLLIMDANTGKELNNILLDNDKYRYTPKNILIKNEKIHIYGDVYNGGEKFDGNSLGFFMTTTNIQGEIIDKKNVLFSDLKTKIEINEKGEVKKKGTIYAHEFVMDDISKNIIMVGEYFQKLKIGNLIFLEFDENFKFKNIHEIEKVENKAELPFNSGTIRNFGIYVKKFGYFDFIFSSYLEKNKGLSFFYENKTDETIIGPYAKSKKNIGIIAYENGKFTNNIISYTSKKPMSILPSKPGFFLLFENDPNTEIEKRIEKINY